ncbi:hypothetical protein HPT30_06250 [Paenibacillus sp. JW14]|uniref:Uncharacterized protein n=1 Tax=Paenibacillus agri TaxID=2744309 RepID=A0A850EPI0_9BACL|nr:hypothetical protein [Paenibacillus agri]
MAGHKYLDENSVCTKTYTILKEIRDWLK